MEEANQNHPAIQLSELNELASTRLDKVRLAARYATAQVAHGLREFFVESPKAVWHNIGPETYAIQSAKRSVEATRLVGRWALDKEIIPLEDAAELLFQPYLGDREAA